MIDDATLSGWELTPSPNGYLQLAVKEIRRLREVYASLAPVAMELRETVDLQVAIQRLVDSVNKSARFASRQQVEAFREKAKQICEQYDECQECRTHEILAQKIGNLQ